MNNKEVAHLWANQSRSEAKGSNFYFEGDTIYSYGSHFPIARHYKGVVLFTTRGYSNSTARHMSIARGACSHKTVFYVSDPLANPSRKHVKDFNENIKALALSAARARNPAAHLETLEAAVDSANDFCERFGFKTRFEIPGDLDLAELRDKARASAERERKAKLARAAKFEADCAEKVAAWLRGEPVTIPYQVSKTYLRQKQTREADTVSGIGGEFVMETSRGATVPLDEAQKAFRFVSIMRKRGGWHRNGEQFKVGDYQLDAVNEQGVVAGCHRITWDEVERFAKTQGWL